jgi:beta,beta-carotene 9',10'-dioxygenase
MNKINPNVYKSQFMETSYIDLEIQGNLPEWLSGELFRNGPAVFDLKSEKLKHWFDGYALLHGFNFKNGKVIYQSKFVQSPEYIKNTKSGRNQNQSWGTPFDTSKNVFARFINAITTKATNTCVNTIKIGSKFYTTSDISAVNEFNPDNLATLATKNNISGSMAAHPAFEKDFIWNLHSTFGRPSKHSIVTFDTNFKKSIHATFSTDKIFYYHSFGNTEKYLIIIEQPLYINLLKLLTAGIKNQSFYKCYEWDKTEFNKVHVFNKHTGELIKLQTNSNFFFFHTINSFEKDGKLVVDFCGYDDNSIIDDFYLDNLTAKGINDENKARLMRLQINLDNNSSELTDFKTNIELPTINKSVAGSEQKFAYGIYSSPNCPYLSDGIIKYDFANNSHSIYTQEKQISGEPVFVKNPNGKAEDDGVLLSLGFDCIENQSYLMILNAINLEFKAKICIPNPIPASLHGNFYPNQMNKNS